MAEEKVIIREECPSNKALGTLSTLLALLLGCAIIFIGRDQYHRVYEAPKPTEFVLASPSGNNSVRIYALDDAVGIEVIRKGHHQPLIRIYNNDKEGAVVGIYGKGKPDSCSAIISGDDDGGKVRIIDREGHVFNVEPGLVPGKRIGDAPK